MSRETRERRVAELEQQGSGKLRLCWIGDELTHLEPGEKLIVVSWKGERDDDA